MITKEFSFIFLRGKHKESLMNEMINDSLLRCNHHFSNFKSKLLKFYEVYLKNIDFFYQYEKI